MSLFPKKETFFEWLGIHLLIIGIPFCITAYIVVTETWPYLPLRKFFNNGHSSRYMDGAKEVIGTAIFLITSGIILSIKWLFTQNKAKAKYLK